MEGARAAGIPDSILRLTGHPALRFLDAEATQMSGPAVAEISILFVSETVCQDSGPCDAPDGRGYEEVGVSHLFAETLVGALAKLPGQPPITLGVAPQPREDRDAVAVRWADLSEAINRQSPNRVEVAIVPREGVRTALQGASHVVGMSSFLLYEAWLLGRPTLSIQP